MRRKDVALAQIREQLAGMFLVSRVRLVDRLQRLIGILELIKLRRLFLFRNEFPDQFLGLDQLRVDLLRQLLETDGGLVEQPPRGHIGLHLLA